METRKKNLNFTMLISKPRQLGPGKTGRPIGILAMKTLKRNSVIANLPNYHKDVKQIKKNSSELP